MIAVDGREVRTPLDLTCDVVVVGSGPAGSAVAERLAHAGADVVVLEEGLPYPTAEVAPDAWTAMARTYRGMAATMARGRSPIPIVQGRAVGGGSVINGAISWRLPRDVWDGWVRDDPALADALPWEALEHETDAVVARLGIAPTDPAIAGRNNALLAAGAAALGLDHRPIARNAVGCRGSGRCLQGCPNGAKQSLDRTLLADAVARGARVVCAARVDRVRFDRGRAVGVSGRTDGGGAFAVTARHGVVVAAGAVQTPALLLRSGLSDPQLGQHFRAHPGASLLARYPDPVRCWEGATQGHEVIGLRDRRLKFEALGVDRGLLAARLPGLGRALAAEVDRMDRFSSWGVAVRARTRGRVGLGWTGSPVVRYELDPEALRDLAAGVAWLGRLAFAAGAVEVLPGVAGFDARVTDPRRLDALEAQPPTDPRAFSVAMTHLFGTCRMSAHPTHGVVRPDFRAHRADALWVVDASVFPSNTGVNPQTSILAVARLAGRSILGSGRSVG